MAWFGGSATFLLHGFGCSGRNHPWLNLHLCVSAFFFCLHRGHPSNISNRVFIHSVNFSLSLCRAKEKNRLKQGDFPPSQRSVPCWGLLIRGRGVYWFGAFDLRVALAVPQLCCIFSGAFVLSPPQAHINFNLLIYVNTFVTISGFGVFRFQTRIPVTSHAHFQCDRPHRYVSTHPTNSCCQGASHFYQSSFLGGFGQSPPAPLIPAYC